MEPLLQISNLSVGYSAGNGERVIALRNVDFSIFPQETLGILGESGSGKSSLALAILGLLPTGSGVDSGQINFGSRDLLKASASELREVRGGRISMIFQEPALALNPVLTAGLQIADVLRAHRNVSRAEAAEQTHAMLRQMGFEDPDRVARAYPHQLSGGQRQRVAIAQALICRPTLLIADEPLSALDVSTQVEIVELLQQIKAEMKLAMIFITHDAGVLSSLADRVAVMRSGEVVAQGKIEELRGNPDAYVQSLVFPEKTLGRAALPKTSSGGADAAPLLQVRKLSKRFAQKHFFSRKEFSIQALGHVDISLGQGKTLAVIGRSGSGKSTLARCVAGFETADSGEILIGGASGGSTQVQMVFQDAAGSLNPRFTALELVAEPMEIAKSGAVTERNERVRSLMEEVGLDAAWGSRRAQEFSGGQRQRLAIARALAARPKLLIFDEALCALDVPLQAQIMRMLLDLQSRYGLAYLYISHDLNFVSLFAQDVAVMEDGQIVEVVPSEKLWESKHPVTQALVRASEELLAPGVEAPR